MANGSFWLFAGVLAVTAGAAQAASDKPKPTPAAETPATPAKKEPEPVSADPQLTTATFGDWVERCQKVNISGETRRVCEIAIGVTASGQSQRLAELAIGRLKKGDPLRATLVLPVNVSFPSAPKISVEGEDAIEFVWKQCIPAGCIADAGFSGEAVKAWREAKTAKVESKFANGQPFNFAISLRGLPQALDALAKEP
jgi:invasion protein IalB